jgi:hypothetical protein
MTSEAEGAGNANCHKLFVKVPSTCSLPHSHGMHVDHTTNRACSALHALVVIDLVVLPEYARRGGHGCGPEEDVLRGAA